MGNNNSNSLENIESKFIAFTDVQFNEMSYLTELQLCRCRVQILALLSRTSNLKKLKLRDMHLDTATATTAVDLKKLEELELVTCSGEISVLLAKVATNITTLFLWSIDLNTSLETTFTKLRKLKLRKCRGEISYLLTQAALVITTLDLGYMHMNTFVAKPFNNLQVLVIRELNAWPNDVSRWCCKDIDISASPLLTRAGRLSEFGGKVKSTWEEEYMF